MTTKALKQKIQIVTIADNQLLLLQFAQIYNEGFQNITGSVEKDETFIEAAKRELMEEINIDADLRELPLEFDFFDRWGFQVKEKVYLCQLKKIPSIKLSHEHQSFKWIPVNEVTQKDFVFPSNFEAFEKALEFMKQ